ncbi:Short C-terminal domain-containing protein [Halorubrum aquaticum]|uniref:Short C-terminal domain-containing protein n=1 Tax=Halorubrum aquaticum TaxID=387340 RepID=A0A1I2ZS17_9EURY|nr:SHOCT domain-containing protein [Halorubrum aquaticum]SFH40637.1 Short C-terminal domain-containing protein [Halorubrum aquaticum]
MTGPLRRAAWNLRYRWRRVFALCVVGGGVLAPFLTDLWWTLPLIWFLGLFVVLPVLHTLAKPLPSSDDRSGGGEREGTNDPALDALRERYARGEIDEREFERKLDRLLETEDAEVAERDRDVAARIRGTVERELERVRE